MSTRCRQVETFPTDIQKGTYVCLLIGISQCEDIMYTEHDVCVQLSVVDVHTRSVTCIFRYCT